MPDAVTDTHVLIWYLQDDARLSATAAGFFDACQHDGGRIHVPTISAVEIVYLAEKGRIPADTLNQLLGELRSDDTVLQMVPLDTGVVMALRSLPRSSVPDMPDRIIGATALSLRLPLISRDGKIRLSSVPTIW
ncbi:MAG TPA: type II toxin-antitoxin system VapC family toxin [Armatimonadota bacterium]|nr:type II toxin-antitoxin system VapC family toxin [Armatimonadota bacterium]